MNWEVVLLAQCLRAARLHFFRNYVASWKGDLVAVKKLKAKIEDVDLIKSFQAETNILAKMRYPSYRYLIR